MLCLSQKTPLKISTKQNLYKNEKLFLIFRKTTERPFINWTFYVILTRQSYNDKNLQIQMWTSYMHVQRTCKSNENTAHACACTPSSETTGRRISCFSALASRMRCVSGRVTLPTSIKMYFYARSCKFEDNAVMLITRGPYLKLNYCVLL